MDHSPVEPAVDAVPQTERGMARYVALWAVALAMMIGAVVAFCLIIDPYAIVGAPRVAGLNAQKPAAATWPRLTKPYTVQHAHPVTLIMGNSSADVGFNPESAAWPQAARPVYNLAIDGGVPANHLRFLQHALSVTNPKHIVLAVNFIESLVQPQHKLSAAAASGFDFEPRMLVLPNGQPNPAYKRGQMADLVFATLSFTAFFDSITTVLEQNDPGATYETPLGWNNGGKFHRWAAEDGSYSLVLNKDRSEVAIYAAWRQHKAVQIDQVAQMVALARGHGADVTIIILPNYTDEMQMLRLFGLDGDYDAWKMQLVKTVWQVSGGAAVVWDFSGYSPYTTEPLPAPGDHVHRLRWFWEPLHFQTALGDLMIARIHGAAEPADFGVRLTPDDVGAQIAAFHAAEAAWTAAHPSDVARVSALMKQ